MFVCCLYVLSGSEHTFVSLHQVRARNLFAVCGELINMLQILSGWAGRWVWWGPRLNQKRALWFLKGRYG